MNKLRLRWRHIHRFYETLEPLLNYAVPKEEKPDGRRIAVLAPHIDDETIGCGGVIVKHAAAGDRVAILTFADCTEERRREGKKAGDILGVARQEYLSYASKSMLAQPQEVLSSLHRFLSEEQPEVVYAPSPLDRHADHLAVNVLLAQHTANYGGDFTVYGYEVWSTLTPNVAIDITAHREHKLRALGCFSSQNKDNNWQAAALGLNRFRGIATGAGDYAEVFYRSSAALHRKTLEHMLGRL